MVSKTTWSKGQRRKNYTAAAASSLSLREADDETKGPAEVRRCRFIEPADAALAPMRLVDDKRVADTPPDTELVVEDRGRVDDAASLGREEPPFREALCGVPDARFLAKR